MREYRLGEIFNLQMGKTPSRNNLSYWGSKDNQWISIADLSKSGKYIEETKEYLSDRAVEESGISVIPANTVVMSFKLSIGKTAITPKSMYSNEAIMAFCDKKVTELLPDYIYYMFLRRKWESGTNKAVMGNTLNKSTLSNIKVKIHKIDKQREIVKILDCASQIIDDREKQLHELDALVKARFVEMFEGKYEIVKLGDVIKTTSGGTPAKAHSEYYENGTIPWLTSGEINAGVITTVKNFITEEGMKNSSAKMIPENSVVIAMYGATAGVTGITRINTTTNQAVCCLLPNGMFVPEFLYYAVSSKKDWMISQCQGGGQPNISQGIIKKIDLINPPLSLQNEFAAFVSQVDKSKVAVQKALDEAQTLFDSLMQEYFG